MRPCREARLGLLRHCRYLGHLCRHSEWHHCQAPTPIYQSCCSWPTDLFLSSTSFTGACGLWGVSMYLDCSLNVSIRSSVLRCTLQQTAMHSSGGPGRQRGSSMWDTYQRQFNHLQCDRCARKMGSRRKQIPEMWWSGIRDGCS